MTINKIEVISFLGVWFLATGAINPSVTETGESVAEVPAPQNTEVPEEENLRLSKEALDAALDQVAEEQKNETEAGATTPNLPKELGLENQDTVLQTNEAEPTVIPVLTDEAEPTAPTASEPTKQTSAIQANDEGNELAEDVQAAGSDKLDTDTLDIDTTPPAAAAPTPSTTASQSTLDYDPRYPRYQQVEPEFAVELLATPRVADRIGDWGGGIDIDYQPAFLQKYGVVSAGASFAWIPGGSRAEGYANLLSIGGSVRYQFHYISGQMVVPVVGYQVRWNSLGPESVNHGMIAGFGLLLNSIDSGSATDFYMSTGVRRTYIFAEVRPLTESGLPDTYFMGLRFEI